MNAPQGSPLTGGLPSDGRVLEFRNFKKDSIGLYQINTNYINGDETITFLNLLLQILLKHLLRYLNHQPRQMNQY